MRNLTKTRLLACLAVLQISTTPLWAQNGRPGNTGITGAQGNLNGRPANTIAGPSNSVNQSPFNNSRPPVFPQAVNSGNSLNRSPFNNGTITGAQGNLSTRPLPSIAGPSNNLNQSPFSSTTRTPVGSTGNANSSNFNTIPQNRNNASFVGGGNSINNNTIPTIPGSKTFTGGNSNNLSNSTTSSKPSLGLAGPANSTNGNSLINSPFNNGTIGRPPVVQSANGGNSSNNNPFNRPNTANIVAGGNSNNSSPFNNTSGRPVVGAVNGGNSSNNSPFTPSGTVVFGDTGPSNSSRNNPNGVRSANNPNSIINTNTNFTPVNNNGYLPAPGGYTTPTYPGQNVVVSNTNVIDYSKPSSEPYVYSGAKSTTPKSAGNANSNRDNINGQPASYSQFNVRAIQFKNTHDREITLNVYYNETPGAIAAQWSANPIQIKLAPLTTATLLNSAQQKITTDRVRFEAEYRGADGTVTKQDFPERYLTRYVNEKPINLNMNGNIEYFAVKPGTHELALR